MKMMPIRIVLLAWLLPLCVVPETLARGLQIVAALETNIVEGENLPNMRPQVMRVLGKRLDALGLPHRITPGQHPQEIMIQAASVPERMDQEVQRQIRVSGLLSFRMVHPDSEQLLASGIVPPGYEILRETRTSPDGSRQVASFLVKKKPERGLTGMYVQRVFVNRNPVTKDPEIDFELNLEGTRLFAELTREYAPKGNKRYQLAIVLDNVLYSAPFINSEIPGGRGQITGSFDVKEATELAQVLNNPLPCRVKISSSSPLDPTVENKIIRNYTIRSMVPILLAILALLAGLAVAIYFLFSFQRRRMRQVGPPPVPQ